MKVYVVGDAKHYADFLENATLTDNITEAEIVLFTGGEDVDPSIYGCRKHQLTSSNIKRDLEEKKVFEQVKLNQLCVGICRGSQLLCCLNGGILVQDCSGHALWTTHGITDHKLEYQITSTHHQMQYPYNLDEKDYDILFVSSPNRSEYYAGDKIQQYYPSQYGEPEIVLYHKENLPKCLAIQGHPEMIPDSPVSHMINELINNLLK